ncbi:MAG: hypothetical protein AAGJ40_12805 [Planctomycetota bacterium]
MSAATESPHNGQTPDGRLDWEWTALVNMSVKVGRRNHRDLADAVIARFQTGRRYQIDLARVNAIRKSAM